MDKKVKFNLWYVGIAIVLFMLLQGVLGQRQQAQITTLSYSEFQSLLAEGRVADVVITDNFIRGTFDEPRNGKTGFRTTRVEREFANELAQYGVEIKGEIESTLVRDLLSWLLPILLILGVWIFMIRRVAGRSGMGGFMSVGKSKAKIYMEREIGVTFDDVAGVDEAKEELQEIVGYLKNPDEYGRLGARIAKGVLLVGPPGTGKTLLARAVAGEAEVPFFSINGSEFVEMFVGVGAARVRDLFDQAHKAAPCIIFIDELDALGRARGPTGFGGGNDEKEQTLNQLLAELDGFDPREGVVLLSATNRPEILDPALLRAGRFDRQVLVDRPDKKGRIEIVKIHMKKIQLGGDADPKKVAELTPGFTGADLANLVNEAALVATRRDAKSVSMADFMAGVERIVAGLEKKSRILSPFERKFVAFHEMGHAVVAMASPSADLVSKVSIIPRGIGALGYTIQRPTEDRYLMIREELETKLAVLLGGRAAEVLVFERLSTGASDDLARATDIARSMVTRYGMTEGLGNMAYDTEPAPMLGLPTGYVPTTRSYSEETARDIDLAVRGIIDAAYEKATKTLTENRAILEDGAAQLLEKESLVESDLEALQAKLRHDVVPIGRKKKARPRPSSARNKSPTDS
jgi:cell division protease FtsH